MNKELFKKAIKQYSKESGIVYYMIRNYLTDGRLIGILKIYDKLNEEHKRR